MLGRPDSFSSQPSLPRFISLKTRKQTKYQISECNVGPRWTLGVPTDCGTGRKLGRVSSQHCNHSLENYLISAAVVIGRWEFKKPI